MLNTLDDRPSFERSADGWTIRVGTWALTYTRIGNRLFQLGLVNRRPIERTRHD